MPSETMINNPYCGQRQIFMLKRKIVVFRSDVTFGDSCLAYWCSQITNSCISLMLSFENVISYETHLSYTRAVPCESCRDYVF